MSHIESDDQEAPYDQYEAFLAAYDAALTDGSTYPVSTTVRRLQLGQAARLGELFGPISRRTANGGASGHLCRVSFTDVRRD